LALLDSMTLLNGGPVNSEVKSDRIKKETEVVIVTHVGCSCDWCEKFEESSINHIYHRLPSTNIFSYQHSEVTEFGVV
jgi:hypothetical protein